jgi:very-short-patch-repair endonuclease
MTEIYNKTSIKERRRSLRQNMTRAEAILWNHIKQKQILGQRFLRQFSIGPYIVDFFCPKLNLSVEVDGDTHLSDDELEYDKIRQQNIETLGITFLRFTNGEIYGALDQVIETIESKVNELMKNPPTPLS